MWPADPLSSGRRRALSAAAELVTAAAPHPLDPELVLDGARPGGRAVGPRRRPAAARARPARQPDRRRPAALAPVGVGAGHPAPRPRRAGPPAAPPDARRARAAGPTRHGLPRLARGAVRRGEAGRPRRAARFRRRVRRTRRRARRAAGGVPRQRVGRPAAGRGRGAVRDAAGPADPARPDRRGLRRRGRRLRGHRLEDRSAAVGGASSPPRRCSWPPTGWAGRG